MGRWGLALRFFDLARGLLLNAPLKRFVAQSFSSKARCRCSHTVVSASTQICFLEFPRMREITHVLPPYLASTRRQAGSHTRQSVKSNTKNVFYTI